MNAPPGTEIEKPFSGPACITEINPPPVPRVTAGKVDPATTAVAAILSGASDPTRTLTMLRPSAEPSVHVPAVAIPLLPVTAEVTESDPPPESTEKVTVTPATG